MNYSWRSRIIKTQPRTCLRRCSTIESVVEQKTSVFIIPVAPRKVKGGSTDPDHVDGVEANLKAGKQQFSCLVLCVAHCSSHEGCSIVRTLELYCAVWTVNRADLSQRFFSSQITFLSYSLPFGVECRRKCLFQPMRISSILSLMIPSYTYLYICHTVMCILKINSFVKFTTSGSPLCEKIRELTGL